MSVELTERLNRLKELTRHIPDEHYKADVLRAIERVEQGLNKDRSRELLDSLKRRSGHSIWLWSALIDVENVL